MKKRIYGFINAQGMTAEDVVSTAQNYENSGIDGLYVFNRTSVSADEEKFLGIVKMVVRAVEIPVMIGIDAERFEDIKKAFYTGASKVVVRYSSLKDKDVILEGSKRFGLDRIALEIDMRENGGDDFFRLHPVKESIEAFGTGSVLLKHVSVSGRLNSILEECGVPVMVRDDLVRNTAKDLLGNENISCLVTNYYNGKNIYEAKYALYEAGIETERYLSSLSFAEMKKNSDGMVPVIVQDYKTNEVLMLAYMNEEAFNKTVETGKMTYYSRSRQELWVKGETSSHFQYLKSLSIDCDNDTLLAKVKQIGAACHTGNRSCFYTDLVKKSFENRDPYQILAGLYDVVVDRKKNPKEGSYTNYLFEKGLDKILKKCGEEATEMVIAAKNPNAEELKYEIADFLYHMTVLMVECDVDWIDIVEELAHRS